MIWPNLTGKHFTATLCICHTHTLTSHHSLHITSSRWRNTPPPRSLLQPSSWNHHTHTHRELPRRKIYIFNTLHPPWRQHNNHSRAPCNSTYPQALIGMHCVLNQAHGGRKSLLKYNNGGRFFGWEGSKDLPHVYMTVSCFFVLFKTSLKWFM